MDLMKQLAKANMSRVSGGIFFDEYLLPIKHDDLKTHRAKLTNGEGLIKYHHLDEETCELTTYTKVGDSYPSKVKTISLDELSDLVLKYEVAHGFDIQAHRFRKPYIED